jgi:hypothetical protein
LEEEVAMKKATLENGGVPRGYEPEFRENLARLEEHLARMKDMTLVDDADNNRDEIGVVVQRAAKLLKEEYPSQKMCDRKLVDANMEYRKMSEPYIPIGEDEKMVNMAKACNVQIDGKGRVSREGLAKMWKIGSKYLGEYANVEVLRKA